MESCAKCGLSRRSYGDHSHTKIAPLVTKITYIKMDLLRSIRNGFANGGPPHSHFYAAWTSRHEPSMIPNALKFATLQMGGGGWVSVHLKCRSKLTYFKKNYFSGPICANIFFAPKTWVQVDTGRTHKVCCTKSQGGCGKKFRGLPKHIAQ